MKMLKGKKGFNQRVVGVILALFSVLIILVVMGLTNTYTADITADVMDDQVTNTAGCGLNSTGGTAGTLVYTNCSAAYDIAGNSLDIQLQVSEDTGNLSSITWAGAIIAVLIAAFAGFLIKGGMEG